MDASMTSTATSRTVAPAPPEDTAIGMVNAIRENVDQCHSILGGLVERMGYALQEAPSVSGEVASAPSVSGLVDDLRHTNDEILRLQSRMSDLKSRCTL